MEIRLLDADMVKGWSNLALMKIATYHRAKGDNVEWFKPLFDYPDMLYVSKIFNFSKDDNYIQGSKIIFGGTGFDITSKLPPQIESCDPDYGFYPSCDFTIQYFSRGCIRQCEWCVVPEKEGAIRPVDPMRPNPNGDWVEVLDNSFFGHSDWSKSIDWLLTNNQPVSLHGVDARTVFQDQAEALLKLDHKKQIHIAWDDANVDMLPHLDRLASFINPSKLMCYVLIGFDSDHENNEARIQEIHRRKMTPYVMCMDRKDPYQKRFQKWVNGFAYKSVGWSAFSSNLTVGV